MELACFPALAASKAKALRIKCVANQKRIGLAFMLYADDSLDFYPVHNNWATTGGKTGQSEIYSGRTPASGRSPRMRDWPRTGGLFEASEVCGGRRVWLEFPCGVNFQ